MVTEDGEEGAPPGSPTLSKKGRMASMGSTRILKSPKSSGKKKRKKAALPQKWHDLRIGSFGPNYTLDEVKHFYSCFSWVDKDYSGEIDVDEWEEFLLGMDQEMTPTDSRRLFIHIDANHNGVISMDEICKVVFNKATPEQQRIMVNVMEHTTRMKKNIQATKDDFTRADLRQLFKTYDENDDKRLKISKLATAFLVIDIGQEVVKKIFTDAGINPITGDIDAEEFVECFYGYLKGKITSKVV